MYVTPEQRYCHDATFKMLVDLLEQQIHNAQYTPSEIRAAAMLAAIHYEICQTHRNVTVPRTAWEAYQKEQKETAIKNQKTEQEDRDRAQQREIDNRIAQEIDEKREDDAI